jgi:hypothetical protein
MPADIAEYKITKSSAPWFKRVVVDDQEKWEVAETLEAYRSWFNALRQAEKIFVRETDSPEELRMQLRFIFPGVDILS